MKTQKLTILMLMAITAHLTGCGKTGTTEYPIVLKLELPASLAKGGERRDKFMERAELLVVKIETKEGTSFQQSYAKGHWEKISLPSFEFPKNLSDKAEITVEVHAKSAEGVKITEAVLKGTGTLKGQEMKQGIQNTLTIKLSLSIQPETWD